MHLMNRMRAWVLSFLGLSPEQKSHPLPNIAKFILGIVILSLCVYYGIKNRAEFGIILNAKPVWLFALTGSLFISMLINAIMFKVFLDHFNLNLKMKEWFGLTILGSFANYLTPIRGGAGVKAIYLKKKYRFKYATFSSIFIAQSLLSIWVGSVLGLCSVFMMYKSYNIFHLEILGLLIVVFLVTSGLIFIDLPIPKSKNRFSIIIKDIIEAWNSIRGRWQLISRVTGLIIFFYIIIFVCLLIGYKSVGINISFVSASVIGILTALSNFTSLTPGNLGVQEIVIGFSSQVMQLGFGKGLAVSVIIRGLQVLIMIILVPIVSYLLIKKRCV